MSVKLVITVPNVNDVLLNFDKLLVHRANSIGGPYIEVTSLLTRIVLVSGVTEYVFDDAVGTELMYYKTQFINTATSALSAFSDPVQGSVSKVKAEVFTDFDGPRGLTLIRGQTFTFRHSFFEDDVGTPMVPFDPAQYPSIKVIDINGQSISESVAVIDGQPGNYKFDFFVPQDAQISIDDRRWRIEWYMLTDKKRQVSAAEVFDVKDLDIKASEVRQHKFLAIENKSTRVFIRLHKRPVDIRLDVQNANAPDTSIGKGGWPTPIPSNGESQIIEVIDEGTFVYALDVSIPAGRATYQPIWTITQGVGVAPDFAFQVIEVPPSTSLQYFASLRMVIDKYQKQAKRVQAYQDSDIYEYLQRGVGLINGYHPLTNWTIETVPAQLAHFWIIGASIWGLNAQHLLETDLQFSFSGQTVTLDYDRTANLESAISRATDMLTNQLPPAKVAYVRQTSKRGSVAVRPYRYSALHNFVYQISSQSSSDIVNTLSQIGLLVIPLMILGLDKMYGLLQNVPNL